MKKVFFLCALICAAQLYGMEPIRTKEEEEKAQRAKVLAIYTSCATFPELRQEIIGKALATSDNRHEPAKIIKKISILHGVEFDKLFNLKDFTSLVHILANQFHDSCFAISCTFKTPVAEKYGELFFQINKLVGANDITALKNVIEQGADINFARISIVHEYMISMMVKKSQPILAIIKLFLENGADPNATVRLGESTAITALDYLNKHFQNALEYDQIKTLLEDAIKNSNICRMGNLSA